MWLEPAGLNADRPNSRAERAGLREGEAIPTRGSGPRRDAGCTKGFGNVCSRLSHCSSHGAYLWQFCLQEPFPRCWSPSSEPQPHLLSSCGLVCLWCRPWGSWASAQTLENKIVSLGSALGRLNVTEALPTPSWGTRAVCVCEHLSWVLSFLLH